MSYNPLYEASKALPVKHIAKQLEDFAATGQDLSRRRFSRSPPPVPSVPSTEWEESRSPSPGERLQDKESDELQNSTADVQFKIQVHDQLERIFAARDKGLLQQLSVSDWEEAAEANVKYDWMLQGIWDERWANQLDKTWKHELQDAPLPEGSSNSAKGGVDPAPGRQRKRRRSDLEEEYHETVRRAVVSQSRQFSRPCYQFVYQFCKEREWIKMGLSQQDWDQHANLDTRAYENVKSRWIKDGLWNDEWTFIPGTMWRHERPRKYPSPYEEFRRADARIAARVEQAERPPGWYFMAPVEPLVIDRRHSIPPSPLEAASDSPKSFSPEPVSQGISSSRDPHSTSPVHKKTIIPPPARKSTVKAKANTNSRDHGRRQAKGAAEKATVPALSPPRTSAKEKGLQKQKTYVEKACATEPRSVRKRPSAAQEKSRPPKVAPNKKGTTAGATVSRPQRAAAIKAMQNLTKSIAR